MKHEDITARIIEGACAVHTALGPGLLEHPYLVCLKYELGKRKLQVNSEVSLPVNYEGIRIDIGYRLDLLVEDIVIVELKAVQQVTSIHKAQLLSYLRLSKKPVGLLINFNVLSLKNGIQRIIN